MFAEGQIKEETASGTAAPLKLKQASPSGKHNAAADVVMGDAKQSATPPNGGLSAPSSNAFMAEPTLSVKPEEKATTGSQGHPERKRRASDDSIDVSCATLNFGALVLHPLCSEPEWSFCRQTQSRS